MHRSTYHWLRTIGVSLAAVLAVSTATIAQDAAHPADAPLRGAAEVGYEPFMYPKPDGTVQGFNFDLNTELAKRLGRPSFEVVSVPWPNIFAGLYAGRYEYIAAPVTITESRANEMLFTEPYLDVQQGFLTLENKRILSMDDLKGKKISVVSGSVQDDWGTENAAQYGIEMMRFDTSPDSLEAVAIGRADAQLNDLQAASWTVKTQGRYVVDTILPPTGRALALAFRPDDTEFRDQVENELECMKLDGTLAQIYENWFGAPPPEGSWTVRADLDGFGAPDWKGYAAAAHEPTCD
jgi:polar amino acid transport system substrate-binding protein